MDHGGRTSRLHAVHNPGLPLYYSFIYNEGTRTQHTAAPTQRHRGTQARLTYSCMGHRHSVVLLHVHVTGIQTIHPIYSKLVALPVKM